MIREKKRILVVVAAMAAVMMIGTASAYFTATDSAKNVWTVGSVDIDLQEPAYDEFKEEETKELMPNETVHKDPMVENTGASEAYVFMEVKVPKAEVSVQGQNGEYSKAKVQELFDYEINDGWVLVNIDEEPSTYNKYVFAYGAEGACVPLKAGEKTPVLFRNTEAFDVPESGLTGMITFKNICDVESIGNTEIEMPVRAFAIQTGNLTEDDVTDPEAVWNVVYNSARPS